MKTVNAVSSLFLVVLMLGCEAGKVAPLEIPDGTLGGTLGGSETGAANGAPGATTSASAEDSGASGDPLMPPMPPPDGGDGTLECNPWTQDCPVGERCLPDSSDGNSPWETNTCFRVRDEPRQLGEGCGVSHGDQFNDNDNCDVGLICQGRCVKLCTGSPDAPICDVPNTRCLMPDDGFENVCLDLDFCDPLLQDCPAGDPCVPYYYDTDHFACTTPWEDKQEFDACWHVDSCVPGLACVGSEFAVECVPDVSGGKLSGCCLAYCDLSAPNCVGAGAQCIPWSTDGMPAPGLDHVGFCGIPQ